MEDFYAEDLVKLWKFQDSLEGHALGLLKNGVELGVYAMSLELARLMARQETFTPDDIDQVKDNAIKVQRLLGQPLDVVVVAHHNLRLGAQCCASLLGCAYSHGQRHVRSPLGLLDWPHVGADALGCQNKKPLDHAVGQHVLHGRQRDGCLASANRCQDHGSVALVEEVSRFVLVGS